jgi:transposase
MCLHPRSVDPVPEETAHVANAPFPKGTTYMTMRDELGAIFEDEDFAHLFPRRGQPAMAPWRLALVTIMQFAEGLSDRQTADAVRAHIDWKYALPWNSTTQASTPRCFRSSGAACWKAVRKVCSSIICSTGIGRWGW